MRLRSVVALLMVSAASAPAQTVLSNNTTQTTADYHSVNASFNVVL